MTVHIFFILSKHWKQHPSDSFRILAKPKGTNKHPQIKYISFVSILQITHLRWPISSQRFCCIIHGSVDLCCRCVVTSAKNLGTFDGFHELWCVQMLRQSFQDQFTDQEGLVGNCQDHEVQSPAWCLPVRFLS